MDTNDDKHHVEQLSLGDHNSFEVLFVKYFPKVKYFIAHLIKSEAIAEELSQDVFVKIWMKKEILIQVQSFNSYIYRMAKNAAINHLEHLNVEYSYMQNYQPQEGDKIEEEIYAKEIEILVQLTIDYLPPQRKKVYEMSRIEGLKTDEIASQLNLSKKTVENHLHLALKEIKKTISLSSVFFL